MEYKNIELSPNDNPSDFFAYCLKHRLYKEMTRDPLFSSRLKNVYEGHKKWQGASACLAIVDNKPIGICLLEYRRNTLDIHCEQAGILKVFNQRKNIWQKQYDWYFIHAGFMSFYIKEDFRRKGVATTLIKNMEQLQYQSLKQQNFPENVLANMKENCIVVTARELATKIVEKSKLFHHVNCDITDGNYKENISSICYQLVYQDNQKKRWGNYCTSSNQVKFKI